MYNALMKLHIPLIRIDNVFAKIKGDVCFLLKKEVFFPIFTMKGIISSLILRMAWPPKADGNKWK